MSKLNVDQRTISGLLSDKKSDFLIPDYQRPYAWTEEQCQTLWDDIFNFRFPGDNFQNFDDNEEYFLGSIVTFKNENNKLEVIDGQQRLTTIMLMLRAFYEKFEYMQDENSISTRKMIEKCIWKTNTFELADKNQLKITSEVATDNDKEEFLELLKTGIAKPGSKNQYTNNYKFFQKQIDNFLSKYPGYFAYLPAAILNNCILLPIEAESQETALRIFSTLNDRGLPLSDADIFKAQLYKYYKDKGEKDQFIEEWKDLEEITESVFSYTYGTPMDELFTRYMYYLRAKENNKSSTTDSLRKFYERNKYAYLKNDQIMQDLRSLLLFWKDVANQNKERFSDSILKKLFILKYAPNGMWQYITSVYFLKNKDENDNLESEQFGRFLDRITGFIFTYTITNPGVNALRTPVFDEMISIINGNEVTFAKYKINKESARVLFDTYQFTNMRAITRSIITWYAYSFDNQQLLDLNESFDIEHIFAKKRQEMESSLKNEDNLESIGNKIILETSINIKASDYRFDDKKKIYSGEMRRGKNKDQSKIAEIHEIIKMDNFDEQDIENRKKNIFDKFFSFLDQQNLLNN